MKSENEKTFVPVRARRTSSGVAEQLREMIVSGQLSAGDKLPNERELALQLGVGRNGLREGLRELEMNGLVDIRPGKGGGTFVIGGRPQSIADQMTDLLRLNSISLEDLTEARILISSAVVPAACKRHTAYDLLALERNVKHVEELFNQGRMMEKTEANIEFHNLLAASTKNPILVIVVRSLSDMAKHVAYMVGPDAASVTVRSRRTFLRALEKRDAVAATKEMVASLKRLQSVQMALASKLQLGRGAPQLGDDLVATPPRLRK